MPPRRPKPPKTVRIKPRVGGAKGCARISKQNVKRPDPGTLPCRICNDKHPGTHLDDPLNTKVKLVICYGKFNTKLYATWVNGRVCSRYNCFVKEYTRELEVRAQSRCAPTHSIISIHTQHTHSHARVRAQLYDRSRRMTDHAA